ncbi:MAG: hypothetical protein L0G63_03210 [Psychrobacter sp.]|uniref:hypothetical protein n=1 Tax=Psychrobacter sp. TaxID=56811 RepID=UPI002648DF1A|nr:hypothetical protein [Psychrobacter sp.]MDN5619442.1 hypothetical protein [Psychrobacter sp.]MDN5619482.1 hypothetical protein [Psychrobacter sp.]
MMLKTIRCGIDSRIDELEQLALETHTATTAYAFIDLGLAWNRLLYNIFNNK